MDWVRGTQLAEGTISEADLDLVTVTDDPAEAVALMVAAREEHPTS